MHIQKLH